MLENSEYIDVVIPVKDRDNERIQRCINSISSHVGMFASITLVDYGSKVPIKVKGADILRVEGNPSFNKAHALNLGIKKGSAKYIMTLDCDMILSSTHLDQIKEKITKDSFIIGTNVRRIDVNRISADYEAMIRVSRSWANEDRTQLFNQANGGFQVYARDFYKFMGGIMESMGVYLGGIDNFTYFIARNNNLNIIDLSYPLLHQEHKNQKQDNFNLTDKEKELAKLYRGYKGRFLDFIVKNKIIKNIEPIGGEKPSDTLFQKFMYEFDHRTEIIQAAVDKQQELVEVCGQWFKLEKAKPKILIAIINNYDVMPNYFVWDMFNLYNHTKKFYPDVDIQHVNACDISHMRNLAARFAQGGNKDNLRYDYLVMLDDDHHYPPDFIVKFMDKCQEKGYEVLTGLTSSKAPPYRSTQYRKITLPINTEENCIRCDEPRDEIIEVEASGPVGMLINTNVFDKLDFPFYNTIYGKDDKGNDTLLGNDLAFCSRLKEKGIKIHLDLSVDFPHNKSFFLSRGKILSSEQAKGKEESSEVPETQEKQ